MDEIIAASALIEPLQEQFPCRRRRKESLISSLRDNQEIRDSLRRLLQFLAVRSLLMRTVFSERDSFGNFGTSPRSLWRPEPRPATNPIPGARGWHGPQ